jgi:hypothetical protein
MREQFKVFKDPTFFEFTQIVSNKPEQDLPLYAQLFILKEVHQFWMHCHNQIFFQFFASNMAIHLVYFYLQRHIIKKPQFALLSWFRVMAAALFTEQIYN